MIIWAIVLLPLHETIIHCVRPTALISLSLVVVVFFPRVPKSDRTTVHKNLIVALAMGQLLLMFSDWASANHVCLNRENSVASR